jgi:hypothetical protein
MIYVKTVCPLVYREWHAPKLQLDNFDFPGTVCVGTNMTSLEADPVDAGYVITTPSKELSNCNDCFHYDATGHFTVTPKWFTESRDSQGNKLITVTGYSPVRATGALVDGGSFTLPDQAKTIGYYNHRFDHGHWLVQLRDIKVTFQSGPQGDLATGKLTLAGIVNYHCVPDAECYQHPDETYPVENTYRTYDASAFWWVWRGPIQPATRAVELPSWMFTLSGANKNELYKAIVRRADEVCQFGDLSAKAAESVRLLNINSLAYGKDLLAIRDLAKGLTTLANPGKGVKNIAKGAAKTYLAAHYGARLTVKDTQEIASAISKVDPVHTEQRIGAQEHVVVDHPGRPDVPISVSLRLSGVIDALTKDQTSIVGGFRKIDRALYELDLMPSAANIWDAVPFSFVVDWFVPIGDMLERQETTSYVATLPVRKVFLTREITWAYRDQFVLENGWSVAGSISKRIYHRVCSDSLPTPPLRVDSPKGLSNHWIEGAALLISNI